MKDLEVKLNIDGAPSVTNRVKAAIEKEFTSLGHHRLQQIWNGQVPPREKTSIDVQGCCISIMDDWECTIFGKSYIDCLVVLSQLHGFLTRYFDKPVGFRVLYPSGKQQTVDVMIRNEKVKTRFFTIGKFVITALVSGLIGYFIKVLVTIFGSQ